MIISFPDNLTSDDSVTTVLDTVKNDMTSVTLQETLSAAGVYTHVADSNSLYKHNADNMEFTEIEGETTSTMSIAQKLRSLTQKYNEVLERLNKIDNQ